MLSSRNSGKYLSAEWARQREEAARDSTRFTSAELEYLEVGGAGQPHGDGDRIDETMHIDTQPVDPLTPVRRDAIDIRDRPEAGGKGYDDLL